MNQIGSWAYYISYLLKKKEIVLADPRATEFKLGDRGVRVVV